ncbi:MAG: Uma2 family endonuclease [Pseudomonadota bacterium]
MKRPAIYADIQALPENLVGEIIDDELIVTPRPALRHCRASTVLTYELVGPFQLGRGGPGGWWIIDEPELHLGRQVLVPDLAGWRRERLPVIPDAVWLELAPDWICEVLSPSTERIDRSRKLKHYANHGVPWIWFLNPVAKTLEVLQLRDGAWMIVATHGEDELVRAAPFEVHELDLRSVWGDGDGG